MLIWIAYIHGSIYIVYSLQYIYIYIYIYIERERERRGVYTNMHIFHIIPLSSLVLSFPLYIYIYI